MAKLIQASEVEAAIRAFFTEEEVEEIQRIIESYEETKQQEIVDYGDTEMTTLSWYEAFTEYADTANNNAGEYADARKSHKRCQRFLASIGVYQPVTDEQYEAVTIIPASAKSRSYPKIDGKRYRFAGHIEG